MLKYIIKRLIFGLVTIFIVSTLTFFLMQQVPGGPFAADKSISKAAQKALEVKYGLDKPITVQYVNYQTKRKGCSSDNILKIPCFSQSGRYINYTFTSDRSSSRCHCGA